MTLTKCGKFYEARIMEFGILHVIGMIFLFILAVLWFFLPFAIFGTQPKIDKLLVEAKSANQHFADRA